MTLQDLGAIGELVGGLAVVLSLVYVAFQVRQNSRQIEQNSRHLEASMYFASGDAFARWWSLLVQRPGEQLPPRADRLASSRHLGDLTPHNIQDPGFSRGQRLVGSRGSSIVHS